MKRAVIFGILIFMLVLKTTMFIPIQIGGFRPELMLMTAIIIGLNEGPYVGLLTGFAAGMLQDLISGGYSILGLGAILMMVTGWLAGQAKMYLKENYVVGGIMISGLAGFTYTILHSVGNGALGIISAPLLVIVQAAVFIGLLSAVFFWPVNKVIIWILSLLPDFPMSLR